MPIQAAAEPTTKLALRVPFILLAVSLTLQQLLQIRTNASLGFLFDFFSVGTSTHPSATSAPWLAEVGSKVWLVQEIAISPLQRMGIDTNKVVSVGGFTGPKPVPRFSQECRLASVCSHVELRLGSRHCSIADAETMQAQFSVGPHARLAGCAPFSTHPPQTR
jgi:hypothetical protein